MLPWLIGGVRTGLQAGWALLGVYVAARLGVHLPADVPAWLDEAALAVVLAAVTAVVQWLERRSDRTRVGRLLRRLARVAMLGTRPAMYLRLPAAPPTPAGDVKRA